MLSMEWLLGIGIAVLLVYSIVITVLLIKRSRRFARRVAQFKRIGAAQIMALKRTSFPAGSRRSPET